MTAPDLITAARAAIKLCCGERAISIPISGRPLIELSKAIAALPPDAVVVSRSLLIDAADFIDRWSYARPEDATVSARLRAAAKGGKGEA